MEEYYQLLLKYTRSSKAPVEHRLRELNAKLGYQINHPCRFLEHTDSYMETLLQSEQARVIQRSVVRGPCGMGSPSRSK